MSCCSRRGFIKYMVGGIAVARMAGPASLVEARTPRREPIRIFVARGILTMDPSRPTATAVAVENGRILAVGSLAEVRAALSGRRARLDRRFANKIILPGFVEAHCHIQDYGLVAEVPYVGYFNRPAPDGGTLERAATLNDVIERLKLAVRGQTLRTGNANLPLFAFGADPIYFGGQHFTKEMLDKASPDTPILLQLDSGHIVCCNSPMLQLVMKDPRWSSITPPNAVIINPATGQPTGELDELNAESVAFSAFRTAYPDFFNAERLARGLIAGGKLARRAGVTTATEGLFGAPTKQAEEEARELFQLITSLPDFPIRVVLDYYLPEVVPVWGHEAVAHVLEARTHDTEKLITGPVKVILDGSVQGYTAQLLPPGYWNNGGNPIWDVTPESFVGLCRPFWNAGFRFIVHSNGDLSTQVSLDGLEQLLQEFPISDHRFNCLHLPITRVEQYERMARLKATANIFCNHLYIYGEQHYNITLGPDRANAAFSPAVAIQHGVPWSLHSDAPVTPLLPLFAAWCAVNRQTTNGGVLGPEHRISVPEALHAITLGAAYILGLENEIGSIEVGKRADFAVLEENPLEVSPIDLRDIPVIATVLGGNVFPNN